MSKDITILYVANLRLNCPYENLSNRQAIRILIRIVGKKHFRASSNLQVKINMLSFLLSLVHFPFLCRSFVQFHFASSVIPLF